jgi:NADPH-dependent glutamate synthase beta subunit-like oxidoreductase
MEIEEIKKIGVEIRTNTLLGRDIAISDMWAQGFKAIFIAIGAHRSRDLKIEGAELDGVLKGVDFLLNINLGYRVELGNRVIVVGGGNVAIDVARSALRQEMDMRRMSREEMRQTLEAARLALRQLSGAEESQDRDLTVAMDVARSALRMGVKEVHMVCLEAKKGTRSDNPREEMPAHIWEIEEAEAEGLQIHPGRGPRRILGREGRVVGLETVRVKNVYDSEGRFNPSFLPETEEVMECDSVILAIGQASDLNWIRHEDGIEVTPRNTIKVDPQTLAATAPGVYAGGDVAFGPRLIVDAVADGHRAALSIDSFLKKGRERTVVGRMRVIQNHRMFERSLSIPRQKMPTLPTNRRVGMAEVELGYDTESAQNEGKRCLKCQINPIFNGDLCIACGGCVDICPEYCFKMVRLSSLEPDNALMALVERRYGKRLDDPELDAIGSAMLMDPERCIRCGACARRCPTGAITMEAVEWEEVIRNGTVH